MLPFRYYLRVRYVECDAQKVVFNSRYGEYVDVSINENLRAAGVLSAFLEGTLDFQLVKQTVAMPHFSEKTRFSPLKRVISPLTDTNFSHFPSENSGTDVQEWA
jgi:hypothetical protein